LKLVGVYNNEHNHSVDHQYRPINSQGLSPHGPRDLERYEKTVKYVEHILQNQSRVKQQTQLREFSAKSEVTLYHKKLCN